MAETKYLKKKLNDNVDLIKDLFDDELLKVRYITNQYNPDHKICVLYFGSLVRRDFIHECITKPFMIYQGIFEGKKIIETLEQSVLISSEIMIVMDIDEIATELMMGKTVVLIDDQEKALIVETNDRIGRTTEEPDTEKALRGPREGFNESLIYNISLLRRKILSPKFKFEYRTIGENTQTNACICYIEGIVDVKALAIFKTRLDQYKPDGVIGTQPILEKVKDSKFSPFETVGSTERPDTLASKILEGKIGFLLDGSPTSLYVPHLFVENFQSNEDYYINMYYASISRMMRIYGFFISILTPALYVAVVSHHWEIIPTPLALAIAQAQTGVPLPTVVECFFLLMVFEVLREGGSRAPAGLGQSLTVVGAIVIGQAAVDARLVSPTMVFIVALSAIAGLINIKTSGSVITMRFVFLVAGGVFGIYGVLFVSLILISHLLNLQSFGVQFLERTLPIQKNITDLLFRFPQENINTSGKGVKQ